MLTTKKYTADVRRKKSIEKCIGETLRLTIKICSGATWYRAKDPPKKTQTAAQQPTQEKSTNERTN